MIHQIKQFTNHSFKLNIFTINDSDEEQDDPLNRSILKASSMKNIKAAEKKAAKHFKNKLDVSNTIK